MTHPDPNSRARRDEVRAMMAACGEEQEMRARWDAFALQVKEYDWTIWHENGRILNAARTAMREAWVEGADPEMAAWAALFEAEKVRNA